MGVVAGVSDLLGTSEPAFRLLISLFAGYPFSFLYRKVVVEKDKPTQHAYFALTGFLLILFNCGFDVIHSIVSIVVTFFLCKHFGSSIKAVAFAFVYLMTHLLVGYFVTESDQYDITWTMPQCILTLRLLSYVWDVYDGHQKQENLSDDQKKTALTQDNMPGLLELFAYCYFYGSVQVGPQYPLTKFRSFASGDFLEKSEDGRRQVPDNFVPCLKRLIPGLIYLSVHQLAVASYSNDFLLSQDFKDSSYFWKWIYCAIWYRVALFKYVGVWLVSEGACILSGLAYNGEDPNTKEVLWNGVRNIRLTTFEFGVSFQSIVDSFNYNTNQWSAKYVFKRLKFLGNKTYSHVLTLFFLALWHGFHLGYFVCFFMEYLTVMSEKQIVALVKKKPQLDDFLRGPARVPTLVVCKLIRLFGSTFGFLPFGLIKKERWWPVYGQLWWGGWIAFMVVWPVLRHFLALSISKSKAKSRSEGEGSEEKKEL